MPACTLYEIKYTAHEYVVMSKIVSITVDSSCNDSDVVNVCHNKLYGKF